METRRAKAATNGQANPTFERVARSPVPTSRMPARFLVVATLVAERLARHFQCLARRLHFAGEIHLLIANANQVIACRIQLNASPVEFGLQGIERFVGITQISKHVKRFMDSVIDHARRGGRDQTTPETGLTLPAVESPNLGLGPHLAQRMGFGHLGDRAPGAAPNCSTRRPNSTACAERKSSYRARATPGLSHQAGL